MSSGLEGMVPGPGCMGAVMVAAVVGVISTIIAVIAGAVWVWHHVGMVIR